MHPPWKIVGVQDAVHAYAQKENDDRVEIRRKFRHFQIKMSTNFYLILFIISSPTKSEL